MKESEEGMIINKLLYYIRINKIFKLMKLFSRIEQAVKVFNLLAKLRMECLCLQYKIVLKEKKKNLASDSYFCYNKNSKLPKGGLSVYESKQ